jgi:arylsulfatase
VFLEEEAMKLNLVGAMTALVAVLTLAIAAVETAAPAVAQEKKPNIIFIMGDDIGWSNIGVYNQGLMAGRTPNLDRMASEGMRFTDYYAEASCTAGRANFITGELPIRTGLTTVGQAGATVGMPDQAPTIATALKSMGYATGQSVGPRNMVHSWATDVDDQTVQPRWGKVGKQKIEDAGELCPERMKTVDDEIRDKALSFIEKAKNNGKPFFLWLNPTRMHVVTHLSDKYESMRTPENGWSIEEAGMAQLDDVVRAVMQKVKDMGVDDNTIIVFSTDNGAENFTWPDGGQTPFAGGKGTALEGGFRAPAIIRWPGKVPAGKVENSIMSGLDWFPTFVAAAGNPNIVDELKQGKQIGDRSYKVHLDGYDQTDLITGKGATKRHEIFYFTEGTLSAVRIDDFKFRFTDQPNGWLGSTVKVDFPIIVNLRLDPYERTGMPTNGGGSLQFFDWYKYEFWRGVFVQQKVAELGQTAIDFPPMQKGASFNLEAVKAQIQAAIAAKHGE